MLMINITERWKHEMVDLRPAKQLVTNHCHSGAIVTACDESDHARFIGKLLERNEPVSLKLQLLEEVAKKINSNGTLDLISEYKRTVETSDELQSTRNFNSSMLNTLQSTNSSMPNQLQSTYSSSLNELQSTGKSNSSALIELQSAGNSNSSVIQSTDYPAVHELQSTENSNSALNEIQSTENSDSFTQNQQLLPNKLGYMLSLLRKLFSFGWKCNIIIAIVCCIMAAVGFAVSPSIIQWVIFAYHWLYPSSRSTTTDVIS